MHRRTRGSTDQPTQERDAGGDVGETVFARLTLDGEPAAILDLFECAEILHPVDVAVTERHFLSDPASAGLAGILGMRVNDTAAEGLDAGIGVEAVQQQVGGIEVGAKGTGVEVIEEGGQDGAIFESGFQGQRRADAVAVAGERLQRFAEDPACTMTRRGPRSKLSDITF
jgi:hypothetical protein